MLGLLVEIDAVPVLGARVSAARGRWSIFTDYLVKSTPPAPALAL